MSKLLDLTQTGVFGRSSKGNGTFTLPGGFTIWWIGGLKPPQIEEAVKVGGVSVMFQTFATMTGEQFLSWVDANSIRLGNRHQIDPVAAEANEKKKQSPEYIAEQKKWAKRNYEARHGLADLEQMKDKARD